MSKIPIKRDIENNNPNEPMMIDKIINVAVPNSHIITIDEIRAQRQAIDVILRNIKGSIPFDMSITINHAKRVLKQKNNIFYDVLDKIESKRTETDIGNDKIENPSDVLQLENGIERDKNKLFEVITTKPQSLTKEFEKIFEYNVERKLEHDEKYAILSHSLVEMIRHYLENKAILVWGTVGSDTSLRKAWFYLVHLVELWLRSISTYGRDACYRLFRLILGLEQLVFTHIFNAYLRNQYQLENKRIDDIIRVFGGQNPDKKKRSIIDKMTGRNKNPEAIHTED
jgi:hypothetical protein